MELRQIYYFIEVAKREHVTEAAVHLHVAQSAVSRQIFNLEAELGVDLFIREGRNVKLTPIGRMFLEHLEQAVTIIENAQREITEYLDPGQGTIRIGFPSSLATHTMPTAISIFRERYPRVKFQLKQGAYYNLIDGVAKGEIDMALLGPVPMNEKKVKGSIFFKENLVALLPSNHPFAGKATLTLDQLRDESFILFPEGFILREIIVNACGQLGFKPEVSFEGEDIDAIKGLVSAGLGVTIIPEITIIDSLPRSTVKIPIIEPNVTRTVGVIIPRDRQLLPTQNLFYLFLMDFFTRMDQFQQ
ncbi:LysR family transcriptional regulator [Bacillus sp. V3B]|uniref:LysR family transcriptional regulator n=1 Tax=Bacillus sp. V3B TaxID=2804915 RepID=UPI00210F16AF|nr:LysR family transcriptional regulator [Bacillus sp. V3B]MCQ6274509.1 LysR family transcriptional regulator [Bacillus sp. V3B]